MSDKLGRQEPRHNEASGYVSSVDGSILIYLHNFVNKFILTKLLDKLKFVWYRRHQNGISYKYILNYIGLFFWLAR